MRDLYSSLSVQRAISPVSVADNTAAVSQIIDRQNYDKLMFAILTGSLADADATFTVLVEHDDASGFGTAVAVPDDMLNGTEAGASFTFAADDSTRKIGYVGDKRYVRLTITPAGNASAALIAAAAILSNGNQQPLA
jgi:hypothetical protein